ncbi:mannose-6-phosphate isomerase [Amylibacter marinus]|uniref:Mannose-6-phosphate isomerase n=1 Tax=Amylibacter marinus TaxID=1475483 RepID=A0ABQ5VYC5_9RHOB|nr:mannose-6-phosphate isomerase [Amylibacter marinus]
MTQKISKVNLAQKLALFDSHWDPKVIADYNGNDIMVVKFVGEFPFHKHEETDDFFLILEGEVILDQEGGHSITLGVGELCVIPRGIVHRPRAEHEAKVLLIEPHGIANSGDGNENMAAPKDWI